MIPNNILTEIFIYFAKFPNRAGIYPMFNIETSNIAGYSEMKQAIDSMPAHSLTTIENYVFGANLEAIGHRVNNITSGSDYLFVDFGEVDCGVDSSNRMTDSARLAITVAYRLKNFSIDLMEQMLAFSHSLDSLVGIRNTMISEQRCHPWLKNVSNSHTFVPFVSEKFSSIGWTLLSNREGYDSFGAKNR